MTGSARRPDRLSRHSFALRLAVANSILIVVACSALSVTLVMRDVAEIRRRLIDHGQTIIGFIARESELSVLSGDRPGLEQLAEAARTQRDVVYCRFFDVAGEELFGAGADTRDLPPPRVVPLAAMAEPVSVTADLWEFQAPVFTKDLRQRGEELVFGPREIEGVPGRQRRIGTVAVGLELGSLLERRRNSFLTAFMVTALVAFLVILVGIVLTRRFTRPLEVLARAADAIAQGDLTTAVPVTTRDEVAAVAESFNAMVASLARSREIIRRHNENLEEMVRTRTEELATALDVRDRYAEDLAAAKNVAEAANLGKSAFLANMSHELRTPLHGILSYARFGIAEAAEATREDLLDYFENIGDSGASLLRLLDDLLDLSKLEAGKMTFELESADLSLLVLSAAENFAPLAAEKKLSIEPIEADFDAVVRVDKTKILQVLSNLLTNAIKFSPPWSRPIEMKIERADGHMRVSVRDHGIGIPRAELDTIFDKFVQSSKTRSSAGGTGLGLAICREIIAGHGGRIWAEAPESAGTAFIFELPVADV